ncbi:MAG: 3'-5' exonuclease [Balneolaceae bacterium]|nr:3'-5' exonuclease [Balneolaceae bacterium]
MFNPTEADERKYLDEIIEKLEDAYINVDENVNRQHKELQEQKNYLYENKTGMDAAEKASIKQSVNMQAISGEAAVAYKERLKKLIKTPYFGRIDFKEVNESNADPIYVGIHSFFDEEENENLIHDWRAPVSSMFYDFEPGQASFEAPTGTREGEIERKRQFRIIDGEMEMMLESDLYIRDDVLQKELSRSADDKMKNIVATIQRDQNAIIRNETSPVLIIQGVAGSGKTSIALHRIAFLLYRFKDSLTSRDIMIISPNKVFSNYISNVLPELGEDTIPEMEMEELANRVLGDKYKFEGFFDQVNKLLEDHDPNFIKRIEYKATSDFLSKLNNYAAWLKRNRFQAHDIKIRFKTISARYLRQRYNANSQLPLMRRQTAIATDVINKAKREFKYTLKKEEKKEIRKQVKAMMGSDNLRVLYKGFYDWLENPEMFQYAKRSTFEYSDLFPLMYLKIQLEGVDSFGKVKHLIVDEMQDYTAVQYAVLSRLFPCNKTILGDANQNVNPYSSTSSEDIQNIFSESDAVTLTKSYRSTYEITKFTQQISPRADVDPVERYGEEPVVLAFDKTRDEHKAILENVREFEASDQNTLGILCKTQKQAKKLHRYLKKHTENIHLLSPGSNVLESGVLITSSHLAKGLEFDRVIVPYVDHKNYKTEVDRSMLYIACTRAMHKLMVTHTGSVSSFIE